ncbi:MAG: HNH endonuclease [Verrucomicrobia bacterium]|nr:HNH endonuclease [Verrucomicrobiota bacterium]
MPFELDHIIAEKHGGQTTSENLALACCYCNRFKGPNLSGVDPLSGEGLRLYHPRLDLWSEHFSWSGSAPTAARSASLHSSGGTADCPSSLTAPGPAHVEEPSHARTRVHESTRQGSGRSRARPRSGFGHTTLESGTA